MASNELPAVVESHAVQPDALRDMLRTVLPELDERQRRLLGGAVATMLGHGGITAVARTKQISRSTVQKAVRELRGDVFGAESGVRVSKPMGPKTPAQAPDLVQSLLDRELRRAALEHLHWTPRSTRSMADELCAGGTMISHVSIANILREFGFELALERDHQSADDATGRAVSIDRMVGQRLYDDEPVAHVTSCSGIRHQPDDIGFRDPAAVGSLDVEIHPRDAVLPTGARSTRDWFELKVDWASTEFWASAACLDSVACWWRKVGAARYPNAHRLTLISVEPRRSSPTSGRHRTAQVDLAVGIPVDVLFIPRGCWRWGSLAHRFLSYRICGGPMGSCLRTIVDSVAKPDGGRDCLGATA